jgi:multidrug efflux pump subunit AcrA (membrane-fusion protein)
MTANVSIVTQNVKSALTLPVRFVTVLDETKGTVTVEDGKITKEVPIVLGIRGEDGLIEIVSGLTESETVIAIQPGVRSAQKQSE